MDPDIGTIELRAKLPNDDLTVIPGLFARVRIRGDEIPDEREALEVLDGALAQAMRRAVVGPLPTALRLSTGLDSLTLLAVAVRHGIELDSITIGVRRGVEFRVARRLCDRVGARNMECLFDDAFLLQSFENIRRQRYEAS